MGKTASERGGTGSERPSAGAFLAQELGHSRDAGVSLRRPAFAGLTDVRRACEQGKLDGLATTLVQVLAVRDALDLRGVPFDSVLRVLMPQHQMADALRSGRVRAIERPAIADCLRQQ